MKIEKKIITVYCFTVLTMGLFSFSVSAQSGTDTETALQGSNDSTLTIAKLTEEQIADFKDKALRKTKELSVYITTISDKSMDDTQRSKAIDMAVSLFMSEANVVEVSSLNNPEPKRRKIRAYLNNLKMLPYSNVSIEWYDIFFTSEFRRRPDGKYEAIATIYQRFIGTSNEWGKYEDITKKNIQIIIQEHTDPVDLKINWEVFLGDIKVIETKKG